MRKIKKNYRKRVLSIDLGSSETKIVEGKDTNNGIVVYNYFTIAMPEGSYRDGEILDKDLLYYTLNQELKNRKIKTKNAYLTINSSAIITREITIPKVKEEEIRGLLQYQIEEYIPMNWDDYNLQYKIISKVYEEDVEKLNIQIIAAPKKIVKEHFKFIKYLDLNPLVLDYQPNSMVKFVTYNSLINNTYPIKNITFAAIDLGFENTKITIFKNHTIILSRIIDIGIGHINEDKYFKALSEKTELIFKYYLTRESDNKIHMVLLYGGGVTIREISNLFSNYFSTPAIVAESFNNMNFQGEFYKYMNSLGAIIRTTEV